MNPEPKYELDELLIQKPFDALDDGERVFALSLCETRARYESLRESLIRVKSEMEFSHATMPKKAKAEIMAAFDRKHEKDQKVVSLWKEEKAWYRRPALRWAAAVGLIGVSIWMLPRFDSENVQIAENKMDKHGDTHVPASSDSSLKTVLQSEAAEDGSLEDMEITEPAPESEKTVKSSPTPNLDSGFIAELEDSTTPAQENKDIESLSQGVTYQLANKALTKTEYEPALEEDIQMNSVDASVETFAVPDEMEVVAATRSQKVQRASAQAETIELATRSKSKKKALSQSTFSFKLSNRSDWKQNNFTAW